MSRRLIVPVLAVLMGLLLLSTVFILLANLLADVVYGIVDPRIRYD